MKEQISKRMKMATEAVFKFLKPVGGRESRIEKMISAREENMSLNHLYK